MDTTAPMHESPVRLFASNIDPPRSLDFQLRPAQSMGTQNLRLHLRSASPEFNSRGTPGPPTGKTHEFGLDAPDDKSLDDKLTCSLNLVCYRPGHAGCVKRDIEVTTNSRWANPKELLEVKKVKPSLVCDDKQLFDVLRHKYEQEMCGIFGRYFSFTTLRGFRLLSASSRQLLKPQTQANDLIVHHF